LVVAGHAAIDAVATPVRDRPPVADRPGTDREALLRAVRGRPFVAGVAGGVGTTTVARALDAFDKGVFTGRRPADVLVCRATGESLIRAARAAQLIGRDYLAPVLAISTTDAPSGPSWPTVARLRLVEPHTSAVIVLPYVRRWRDLAVPLDDVTGLLTRPPTELPSVLRAYALAARAVRAALDGTPVLHPSPTSAARFRPSPQASPDRKHIR
jgi:hypothetical protein